MPWLSLKAGFRSTPNHRSFHWRFALSHRALILSGPCRSANHGHWVGAQGVVKAQELFYFRRGDCESAQSYGLPWYRSIALGKNREAHSAHDQSQAQSLSTIDRSCQKRGCLVTRKLPYVAHPVEGSAVLNWCESVLRKADSRNFFYVPWCCGFVLE